MNISIQEYYPETNTFALQINDSGNIRYADIGYETLVALTGMEISPYEFTNTQFDLMVTLIT